MCTVENGLGGGGGIQKKVLWVACQGRKKGKPCETIIPLPSRGLKKKEEKKKNLLQNQFFFPGKIFGYF